eukprot:3204748-Prymnesium_polylepis.1
MIVLVSLPRARYASHCESRSSGLAQPVQHPSSSPPFSSLGPSRAPAADERLCYSSILPVALLVPANPP